MDSILTWTYSATKDKRTGQYYKAFFNSNFALANVYFGCIKSHYEAEVEKKSDFAE